MYSLFPYKVKVIRFQGTDVSFRRKGISPTPTHFFTSNIEYRFLYWQLLSLILLKMQLHCPWFLGE